MLIVGIIVSIIVFSLIVLIHEFGHFKSARFFGVKVEEFGLGIPPRAKKLWKDKLGTVYSLNWLPIGGFVKLKGENSLDEKKSKDNDRLIDKPAWQQSIIILAGVFMNFLLAIFIFSLLFFVGVKPIGINDKIETGLDLKLIPTFSGALESGFIEYRKGLLLNPLKDSLAEKAGIKEMDQLIKVNGESVTTPDEMIAIVSENPGKEVSFEILRGQLSYHIKVTPSKEGKIGSYVGNNLIINKNFKYNYGFFESIKYGALETYNQSLLTFKAIGILFRKLIAPETKQERSEALNSVSGPVGIVNIVTDSISSGLSVILILAAIISISLGVFNLLPIPALDGGRFFIILINSTIKKLIGKDIIGKELEQIAHITFFIILIFLSILITYNDIIKAYN